MSNGICIGPQIVHETVDGEAIVINLGTGEYHALQGPSGRAWDLLAAGEQPAAIAARIAADAGVPPAPVLTSLQALFSHLAGLGLLQGPAGVTDADPGFTFPWPESYSDMTDHLLVDPIHDVDRATGWPARQPSA